MSTPAEDLSSEIIPFKKIAEAFALWGSVLVTIIHALDRGKVEPSDFEKFIEEKETAAARTELETEYPENGT